MTAVLYIHGFLSSPLSRKAQQTEAWLKKYYPEVKFLCPQLSSYPDEARKTLEKILENYSPASVYAIGSSLGGFWASYLLENHCIAKAILINPAVDPHTRFPEFVGVELKSYYSEDVFTLTKKDVDDLARYDVEVRQPDKYWLMVQKGDEALDYRLAVEKYKACRQLVENGGSHTFKGYENWLPEIARFFFSS